MLRRSVYSLGRTFAPDREKWPRCVVLRRVPSRWWEEECRAFLMEHGGSGTVLNIQLPLYLETGTSRGLCFAELESEQAVGNVYAAAARQWGLAPVEEISREATPFDLAWGVAILAEPYLGKKPSGPRGTLAEETLMGTLQMTADRFLLNPDILFDIEKAHNSRFKLPGATGKKI